MTLIRIIEAFFSIITKLIISSLERNPNGNPIARLLDTLLPNRDERRREIEEFRFNNNMTLEERRTLTVTKPEPEIIPINTIKFSNENLEKEEQITETIKVRERYDDGYTTSYHTIEKQVIASKIKTLWENIYNQDLNQFCATYLGRNEKSLISFIAERITRKGKIHTGFMFFIFSIPKAKELSLDTFKQILSTNKFTIAPDNLPIMGLWENKVLDQIFSQYNEQQLKKLYTQAYNEEEYVQILQRAYQFSLFDLPVFSNMEEIDTYTKELIAIKTNGEFFYKINANNKNIINLDNFTENVFQFKVLRNFQDLHFWGTELSHCITSYHDRAKSGSSTLIGVFKNNKPYANIELDNYGQIRQIKGLANKAISEEVEFKKMIQKALTNELY